MNYTKAVQAPGAWRGVGRSPTSSAHPATPKTRRSPPKPPTTCTPSGNPSAHPAGTVTAGTPVKLQGAQNVASPVSSSPSGATPGAGTVSSASFPSSNRPSASRSASCAARALS